MNWTYILLGILALIFGIYTINARRDVNYDSIRLKNMKTLFGQKNGRIAHLIAYGFIPLILGFLMILKTFGIEL